MCTAVQIRYGIVRDAVAAASLLARAMPPVADVGALARTYADRYALAAADDPDFPPDTATVYARAFATRYARARRPSPHEGDHRGA